MPDIGPRRIAEFIEPLRVKPGHRVRLPRDFDTAGHRQRSKEEAREILAAGVELLAEYQSRLAAQDTYALLVFSKEQRAFYGQHAPAGIDLDSLVPLGPTFVLKATFLADMAGTPGVPGRTMVAEMWLYPDGSRILELSTKCRPPEAFQVAAETRAYLTGRGITLTGAQQTKTRAALDFFRAEAAEVRRRSAR